MVRKNRVTSLQGPRREAILKTAMHLFSAHGVDTVTTRQIASAVGISQPSLYAHFPTKQALTEGVCVLAFESLSSAMSLVARRAPDLDAQKEMARVYIDFGLTEPDAYRIAFMLAVSDEVEGGAMAAGLDAFATHRQFLAAVLGPGVASEDVDALAQSLWASLHGLVSLLIVRPTFPWVERERLIAVHLKGLMASVKSLMET